MPLDIQSVYEFAFKWTRFVWLPIYALKELIKLIFGKEEKKK